MRNDPWRRDAASYPLRGELMPRYTDVDIWQHMNNAALISMHGEAVQMALRSVFGETVWRDSEPVIACLSNATDFLAEAYYPAPIAWGVRLLGVDAEGLRVASALFQNEQCIGLHETRVTAWAQGAVIGFSSGQLRALCDAEVPGADELTRVPSAQIQVNSSGTPSGSVDTQTIVRPLSEFPWKTAVSVRFGDSDARRLASDTFLSRCTEQMRVGFLHAVSGVRRHQQQVGMMVGHVALRWLHRAMPGNEWQVGCGVAHLGGKSLALRGAIYEADRCVAVCESVMVTIDQQTRCSVQIPDETRERFGRYRLAGLQEQVGST